MIELTPELQNMAACVLRAGTAAGRVLNGEIEAYDSLIDNLHELETRAHDTADSATEAKAHAIEERSN